MQLASLHDGPPDAGVPERSGPSQFRLLAALALAVVALLWLLNRGGAEDSEAAPPPTEPATTTSPAPLGTIVVQDLPPTTAVAGLPTDRPSLDALPDGLRGVLFALLEDGDLAEVDLATRAVRRWDLPPSAGAGARLAVLRDGLLIERERTLVAIPRGAAPDTPLVSRSGVGQIVSDNGVAALVETDSVLGLYLVVDGLGNVVGQGDLGTSRKALAPLDEGAVAVQAGDTVGIVASDAEPTVLFSGQVLAADGQGMAWIDCSSLLRCDVRQGTWSDPSGPEIHLARRPDGQLAGWYTTGERALVLREFGPVGGLGAGVVTADGAIRRIPAVTRRASVALSTDRGWALVATEGELLATPLDDDGPSRPLDLGQRVVAVAVSNAPLAAAPAS
ncbi:MAG: hypothetical protein OEY23_00495 [Acidimicrobiia bacterium]|nr:hypothetical protein [Acidimicrobiia bacterium]